MQNIALYCFGIIGRLWRRIDCRQEHPAVHQRQIKRGTLQLPDKKQMVICGYYRPPDRVDESYLTHSYEEISALQSTYKKSIFIVSGDFNLPDIQWSDNTTTGHSYPHRVSQNFLDLAHDLSLEQMVDFPTRYENTLDLVLTSHPAFMTCCKPLPPIGDHDIVLYDSSHQVVRTRPPRRKILLEQS